MIEITDAAARQIKASLSANQVPRMFLAAIDGTGAHYGLGISEAQKDDILFQSKGITIHMSPMDAELLGETIIDYVDDEEIGKGFIIRGPIDEIGCGCGCGHHHDPEEGEHDCGSC